MEKLVGHFGHFGAIDGSLYVFHRKNEDELIVDAELRGNFRVIIQGPDKMSLWWQECINFATITQCLVAFELIHNSSSSFFLPHYHYSVGSSFGEISIAMLKGGKLLRNYSIKFSIFSRTLKLSSAYRFSGSNFRSNCSPLFHDVKLWVHDSRCYSNEKGKHLMLSHRNCRL